MDTQPIQIRCTCCERTDTADIAAVDYDALTAALGQDTPAATDDPHAAHHALHDYDHPEGTR